LAFSRAGLRPSPSQTWPTFSRVGGARSAGRPAWVGGPAWPTPMRGAAAGEAGKGPRGSSTRRHPQTNLFGGGAVYLIEKLGLAAPAAGHIYPARGRLPYWMLIPRPCLGGLGTSHGPFQFTCGTASAGGSAVQGSGGAVRSTDIPGRCADMCPFGARGPGIDLFWAGHGAWKALGSPGGPGVSRIFSGGHSGRHQPTHASPTASGEVVLYHRQGGFGAAAAQTVGNNGRARKNFQLESIGGAPRPNLSHLLRRNGGIERGGLRAFKGPG